MTRLLLAAHAALAAGVLVAAMAWSPVAGLDALVGTVAIGGLGLAAALVAYGRWWWRLPLVAVDLWYAVYGLILVGTLDITGDPGPGVLLQDARLDHLLGEPTTRIVVGLVWLLGGMVGAMAVGRSRRRTVREGSGDSR